MNFHQMVMTPSDLFLAGTTTVTPASEFDSHTLAVLRGRLVRYLMRSREVSHISFITSLWSADSKKTSR